MKDHIKCVYSIDKVWCLQIFIHLLTYWKASVCVVSVTFVWFDILKLDNFQCRVFPYVHIYALVFTIEF